MFIQEHNAETGKITQRELTTAEIKKREKIEADYQAEIEAKKTARQALLNKLGITAEEAQLLLGGN
jgi:hypothetical protein